MKRLFSFVLAVVMLAALVVPASAGFSDAAEISILDTEAVEVLSDLKVITGFPDGSFKPAETLTRAQAAKILCCIELGTEEADALSATGSTFSDVPATHWANKFVEYCASKGIVAGVGSGKFNPDGKLTGYAFGKMLLVALGVDGSTLTGDGWDAKTMRQLTNKHLDYGVTVDGNELDRQSACRMALNALFDGEASSFEKTLAYRVFKVMREQKGNNEDFYYRPVYLYISEDADLYWDNTELQITSSPVRIHPNGPITGDAFVKLLGVTDLSLQNLIAYRSNIKWDSKNSNVKDVWHVGNTENYFRSENGVRLEFYYNPQKSLYTVLHIPTWAGKIIEVTEPVKAADGSVEVDGSVTFEEYGACPSNDYTQADVGKYGLFNGSSTKSWTKVSKATEGVAATYVTGKLEACETDKSVTIDGTVYPYPYTAMVARSADKYLEEGGAIGDTVTIVLDSYGFCYAVWK